jgi:hypothetical protein
VGVVRQVLALTTLVIAIVAWLNLELLTLVVVIVGIHPEITTLVGLVVLGAVVSWPTRTRGPN